MAPAIISRKKMAVIFGQLRRSASIFGSAGLAVCRCDGEYDVTRFGKDLPVSIGVLAGFDLFFLSIGIHYAEGRCTTKDEPFPSVLFTSMWPP